MVGTTVFTARRIITMDPDIADAEAVAVRDGRIVAVGAAGDLGGEVDDTFADAVLVPGPIDQHLHPILGATTLTTEVIAIEDQGAAGRTFPAAHSPEEYRARLAGAERALPPGEWLFSWGYHALWHGPLDRTALDAVSATRPIMVWQRSCHEFFQQRGHHGAGFDRRGHGRTGSGQRHGGCRGRALVGSPGRIC